MTANIVAALLSRATGAVNVSSNVPNKTIREAADLIEAQDEVIASLSKALSTSQTALNDWLHVYASDLCAPDEVKESENRIAEFGTIGYIADVGAVIRAALTAAKTHLEK